MEHSSKHQRVFPEIGLKSRQVVSTSPLQEAVFPYGIRFLHMSRSVASSGRQRPRHWLRGAPNRACGGDLFVDISERKRSEEIAQRLASIVESTRAQSGSSVIWPKKSSVSCSGSRAPGQERVGNCTGDCTSHSGRHGRGSQTRNRGTHPGPGKCPRAFRGIALDRSRATRSGHAGAFALISA